MAATGGLMFGYVVGVSGGVTSMPPFLEKFFPVVHRKTQDQSQTNSNYCKTLGRRPTMLIAGIFFLAGVVLNAAAQDLVMLIVGRILLGCGVGFANEMETTTKAGFRR
ncbi:Sugar transport protein 13 [Linum perenne]